VIARLCLVVAICAGCHREVDRSPAISHDAEPVWRAKLVEDRVENDHALKTDVSSPLAGIERFTPTAAAYVAVDDKGLRLEAQPSPATRASFEPVDAAHWTWRPAGPDVTATSVDGKQALTAGAIAEPVLIRLTPRYTVKAQLARNTLIVTAYDAERPQVVAFRALSYFEPDAHFVVNATLDRLATPAPIDLATSRGLTKPFLHIGTLRFALGGSRVSLEAYRPADSTGADLFVPFRDATSGKDSYGAARFLDLVVPADPGTPVLIDFNRAYNPLCAYSPAYNCPLPPPENTLALAITAGERDPHMH
jgi:uncharacterized protein